jgi:hypothetical protein
MASGDAGKSSRLVIGGAQRVPITNLATHRTPLTVDEFLVIDAQISMLRVVQPSGFMNRW